MNFHFKNSQKDHFDTKGSFWHKKMWKISKRIIFADFVEMKHFLIKLVFIVT